MRKRINIILIFVALLIVNQSESEQIYIKDIYITKNDTLFQMEIIYYDFSSENESFKKDVYQSDDIFLLGVNSLNEKNYNMRLCENCIISADIIDNIDQIVHIMNSIKIPLAANIICVPEGSEDIEFNSVKNINTSFYNLRVIKGNTTGFVSLTDRNGNNKGLLLIHNGTFVKFLDEMHADVLNAIINRAESMDYIFSQGQISASLEIIDCFFSEENGTQVINLNCFLSKLNGINDYTIDKTIYINNLKSELKNDILNLYLDPVINSVYNLHCRCTHKNGLCDNINININVI